MTQSQNKIILPIKVIIIICQLSNKMD